MPHKGKWRKSRRHMMSRGPRLVGDSEVRGANYHEQPSEKGVFTRPVPFWHKAASSAERHEEGRKTVLGQWGQSSQGQAVPAGGEGAIEATLGECGKHQSSRAEGWPDGRGGRVQGGPQGRVTDFWVTVCQGHMQHLLLIRAPISCCQSFHVRE